MNIHPRTTNVNEARGLINAAVGKATREQDLTYTELIYILADIQHTYACDALREERKERKVGE